MTSHIIPNWGDGVKETLEFKTTIFTSHSGKEQRSAERMRPRRRVEFTALMYGNMLRQFQGYMHSRTVAPLTIPDPARRGAVLTEAAPAGATQLMLQGDVSWLAPGGQFAISVIDRTALRTATGANHVGAFAVTAFDVSFDIGSTARVTLSEPLGAIWPDGAEVRPVVSGHLANSVTATFPTDDVGTVAVVFDAVVPSPPPAFNSTLPMFNGRPILVAKPNWQQSPQVEFLNDVKTVDYGRGVVHRSMPIDFYSRISQFAYVDRARADIGHVVDLFVAMKGRRGEFWSPSWTNDIIPAASIAPGSDELLAQVPLLAANYTGSKVNQAVGILLNNGTWLMRRVLSITSVTLGSGGSYSPEYDDGFSSGAPVATPLFMVKLDAPFPSGVVRAAIDRICWVYTSRFASDTLTVDWVTDDAARCVANIMSREALPAETM